MSCSISYDILRNGTLNCLLTAWSQYKWSEWFLSAHMWRNWIGGLAPKTVRAKIVWPKQDRSTLTHTHTPTCIHHRIQLAVGDITMSVWKPTIAWFPHITSHDLISYFIEAISCLYQIHHTYITTYITSHHLHITFLYHIMSTPRTSHNRMGRPKYIAPYHFNIISLSYHARSISISSH